MPGPATDSYDDLDPAAIAAEIGESLFSASPSDPVVDAPVIDTPVAPVETAPVATAPETKPPETAPVVTDPTTPAVIPGQNSVSAPLPKSWKREMAPVWEKAAPEIKAYVAEREAQVMRGINQYQQGYQAWDNLIKPFQPVLEANPDVNPIALMQGLMATHLQLLDPGVPSAQKTTLASNLLKSYGITLDPSAGPAPDAILIDRLAAAERKIAEFSQKQTVAERTRQAEELNNFTKSVEAFAADPKNEYFNEVSNDILRFIKTGAAADLPTAYELSCWANPAVRAKMQAKQLAANPAPAQPRAKNGTFRNIEGEPEVKSKVAKPGSIESTIDAVIAKNFTKH